MYGAPKVSGMEGLYCITALIIITIDKIVIKQQNKHDKGYTKSIRTKDHARNKFSLNANKWGKINSKDEYISLELQQQDITRKHTTTGEVMQDTHLLRTRHR
jgi:hypothetical protein